MKSPGKLTLLLLTFLIAGAAWSIGIGAHELLGHGGHCARDPNCTWVYADAMYFDGDYADGVVNNWQIASGSLLNIILSTLAAGILWLAKPRSFALYVFLWALTGVGLIQSGAYIAFGWLIHPGMDWAQFVEKAGGDAKAQGLAIFAGVLLIIAGVLACRRLMPQVQSAKGVLSGLPLVIAAYLGFSATALGASWFVPADDRIFMLYGGLGSGALFMFWFLFSALPNGGPSPLLASKQGGATAIISMVVIFLYVIVLGRGIHF